MSQLLILPINQPCMTAGFKTKAYQEQFSVPHYGCDLVADTNTLFACGNGKVVCAGMDNVVGNTVCIIYEDVWHPGQKKAVSVAVRYFHLASIKVKVGQAVTKDTVVGYYGATGKYVSGAHLHLEIDSDAKNWQGVPGLTPSKSTFYYRGGDTMINPADILHCYSGDKQSMRFSDAKYNGQPYAVKGGFATTNTLIYTPVLKEDYQAKYNAEVKAHATTKASLNKVQGELSKAKTDLANANQIILAVRAAVK